MLIDVNSDPISPSVLLLLTHARLNKHRAAIPLAVATLVKDTCEYLMDV